jgi:vacuolar-type H+-ATPase subunit F/Vma7
LVIVTTPDLSEGYRLAGGSVAPASSIAEAEAQLRKLAADQDVAVIGVHAPFWHALSPGLVQELEARSLPVIIDIPGGAEGESRGRRARLIELFRHAIGHRIAFGGDAEAS